MKEDWIDIELGKLSSFVIGGDWGKDERFDDSEYDLAYCIRGAEFRSWKEDKGNTATLRKLKRNSIGKRKLSNGDILIEISGGGPDQPVGRTVIIDNSVLHNFKDYPVVCTNFLRLFRPITTSIGIWLNTYLEFFYCAGKSIPYLGFSNNLRNLKYKRFETVKIPLAPLPEQRAIVAKIEQLFSELDNGIKNLKHAKAKLDIYRQAVLKKAFEGELTKEWRDKQTDLPTADELLEQIQEERHKHYENQLTEWEEAVAKWEANGYPRKKPIKPKRFKNLRTIDNKLKEELIDIPDDWKWIPMGSIVNDIVVGYVGPIKKYLTDNQQEGVRFLSTTHIGEKGFIDHEFRYVTRQFNSNNKKSSVYPGDILIARHGDSGKACEVPPIIKNAQVSNAVIVRPNGILQYTPFVIYCFNFLKYSLRKKRVGGVQQVVNTTTMEAFAFPLNSKLEQQQIVQEIESRLSVCDNILADIEESLDKSNALRQSILKMAFVGKLLSEEELEACRREPDWEPAEDLLSRIKQVQGS